MIARRSYSDADLTPFGSRLKKAYEESGYTQSSFERACGFPQGRMTRLLYDPKINAIAMDKLVVILRRTGVRFEWLAAGLEPMFSTEATTPAQRAAQLALSARAPRELIAHVQRQNEEAHATWTEHDWSTAYQQALQRWHDPKYRRELRRVVMPPADRRRPANE